MSNLKKGSTVGGFAIVSEADENQHLHDVSEIDGLGDGATAETGPGSDFDADTLNGLHYSDMAQNFVNRSGDTIISNVSVTDSPTNDLSAISRGYTLDYFQTSVISDSPTIPFVSISPTCNLSYDGGTGNVTFSAGDILIGGSRYSFNNLSVGLSPSASSTYVIYVDVNNGTIELSVENNYVTHDYTRIEVGTITFNSSAQLQSVDQRPVMCNLNGISMNESSTPNSMVLSDASGNVDIDWFGVLSASTKDTVNIRGNTTTTSGSTETYIITDYDEYSSYIATSNIASTSISGDIITVNAPTVSQETEIILSVSRNGNTLSFIIGVTP